MTTTITRPRLELKLRQKLARDIKERLTPEGKPKDSTNDYERHLYARKLFLEGKTLGEVAKALAELGLADVMPHKREKYLADVLLSSLVLGV